MSYAVRGSVAARAPWFAGLLLALAPTAADAQALGFRNDTPAPVIVQGVSIVNRIPRRDRAHVLQPGEVCWDPVPVSGNRLITIADARLPIRTLYQNSILCPGKDLFLSIQVDIPPPLPGQRQLAVRVKLVPTNPPAPPPDRTGGSRPRR
jgi:hypothetical protein